MIRFATIGTGWIVDAFLEGAALVEGLQYAGAYSRDLARARQFAQRHGAPLAFSDLTELAQSPDIDAVYIASPNGLHVEQSLMCLRHGKHVLCEKTAAPRAGDARLLLDTAARHGAVFLEAIFTLHLPRMQILADAVGRLGRISFARLDYSQYSSKYPAYLAGEIPNVFNPSLCNGVLTDLGVYCVYPAVRLFGMPKEVRGRATFLDSGADAAGCAVLEYPQMQAVLTYSKTGQSRIGCEIVGDLGTVTLSSISRLETMRFIDLKGDVHALFGLEDRDVSMSYEARDFLGCITERELFEERYAYWSCLFREVSDVMVNIRRTAGIRFPGDQD